jgi:beta-lactamase class A
MMDFKYRKNGVENYTSAKDMALVMEKIYRKELINADVSKRSLELLKNQKINDRIPVKLPDGVTVAHKTGLERYVCHDVGIVFTEKGDYLIVVLTKTKKGFRQAKMFIADMALETYNYYKQF